MGAQISYLCQFPCLDASDSFDQSDIPGKFPLTKRKIQAQSNSLIKLELITIASTTTNSREIFFIDEQSYQPDKSSGQLSQELSFVQVANSFYRKGNLQEAINNYMMALHKVDRKDIRMADIHFAIGQCYFRMGNFNTALKHCKLSQTKYTELTGKMSQGVAMTCNLIGHLQCQINDYVLAQHYYQKAYQIYHEQMNHNCQNLLQVGFNLGALYINIGLDEKALDVYQQMQALIQQNRSITRDSIVLELYRCLGVSCYKLKSYENSILYFSKAFSLCQRLPAAKKNEINKIMLTFQIIKEQIVNIPKLSKNKITLSAIKKFNQLKNQKSLNI